MLDASGSVSTGTSLGLEQKPTYLDDARLAPRELGRSRTPSNNGQETVSHFTNSDPKPKRSVSDTSVTERVVLAAASIVEPDQIPEQYGRADSTFKVTMTPFELVKMCTKWPRGTLFHIPDGTPTSQYDAEGHHISTALSKKAWYLAILRRQFLDAKQVIFVPMFHANLNRWTACFAYTSSRYRIFTYEAEYLHTLSFCNAIRAEIVKLATLFADQQKTEFIGSVSHELRSPLHGILAAIEFLQDTECSAFQKSCVDTADACAHTLMDTSKPSHFKHSHPAS
jgi:hypothetical protein